MKSEFELLVEKYVHWLKDKTSVKEVRNDWVEITTPYLDRHNDYLQIYARKDGDNFILTDDSSTIEDLRMSGCELKTSKRKKLLEQTLNGFGVSLEKDALTVRATNLDFPQRKHDLIQSILSVNDMFFLAESTVASLFFEDVSSWFDSIGVRYTPRARFSGKSGFVHNFDFVIPKSNSEPERIIQLVNKPSRDSAQKIAFSWIDTNESRANSKAFALINDKNTPAGGLVDIQDALREYEVEPLLWSKKDQFANKLVA